MKRKKLRKRRFLAMLLVFVLCMGMLDISAFAAAPGEDIAAGSDQKEESGEESGQETEDSQKGNDRQSDGAQNSEGSKPSGDTQNSGDAQQPNGAQDSEKSQLSGDAQNTGTDPESVKVEVGGDTETEENPEENLTPEYASIEEFLAAAAAIGETDDEDSVREAIENCLDIYGRLSEEDKADEAVQKAYEAVKAYEEDLGQGGIDTLDDTDIYTVIYRDSAEYGGKEFQRTEGLNNGDATPGYSDGWFSEKDKDFKMWSPTWKDKIEGNDHTITYTAVYKEKNLQYPFRIYYVWSGNQEEAAPDYTDVLYRGDSYNVESPKLNVPFEYAVNFPVIEGTVGYTTSDVKYWVTYTPKVKIQHIYRVNGKIVGTVNDTEKEVSFGRSLTENSYGITKKLSYDGKTFTYTSADNVTLPGKLSELTEQPVLKLYYDRTEKPTHNVTIHYKWAGTDVKAAEDQIMPFEEGKLYLINSPTDIKSAAFGNIITDYAQMTINGIMGTEDIEKTVYYSPRLEMKYILQENGENKYSGYYQVNWKGEFGRSYTYNSFKEGDSFNAADPVWGQYYFTKAVEAVIPANPSELKNTPEITLYFNKTIPTTLTVTKTADKTEVTPGDKVTYTIIVENTGTVVAKDVKVTDELDSNLKFISSTIAGNGNVYVIGDIPAGQSRTLEITTQVADGAKVGTDIVNTAKASYANNPDTDDPDDTIVIPVTKTPDEEKVTITLKYVYADENGSETELQTDKEVQVVKGEEYDVSEFAYETITADGVSYRQDSVEGDLKGTATEDKMITVKYVIVENGSENPPTPPTPPGGGGGGDDDDDDDDPDPTPTPPTPPAPDPIPVVPIPVDPVPQAVVPNVTPVDPTPAAEAAPAAVTAEIAEEAVPLAEGEETEDKQTVEVEEEAIPLAGGEGGSWALFNFALMNLAIFESIMLLIGYFVHTKNDEEERKLKKKGLFRIISLPIAVISLIVFILTENIHLQTALVDKYTIIMLLIAIVQTIMVVLSNKKYEEEQEEQ